MTHELDAGLRDLMLDFDDEHVLTIKLLAQPQSSRTQNVTLDNFRYSGTSQRSISSPDSDL